MPGRFNHRWHKDIGLHRHCVLTAIAAWDQSPAPGRSTTATSPTMVDRSRYVFRQNKIQWSTKQDKLFDKSGSDVRQNRSTLTLWCMMRLVTS